jgi:hypothetical protein
MLSQRLLEGNHLLWRRLPGGNCVRDHNGIFPCLRAGRVSRLVRKARSALVI